MTNPERDHGGGLDAAIARFGGRRIDWIDLSTGINPVAYPIPPVARNAWTALPDKAALSTLLSAAQRFWKVPDSTDILAAPGASSLIAQIPSLASAGRVCIPSPTYNEHAAAFDAHGWHQGDAASDAQVVVHPNNPDGRLWGKHDLPAPKATLTVIDESFCDVMPDQSLISMASEPGTLVLKSFGKFWGLAGLRLGFAIGDPKLVAQLREKLGPWAVSGPALEVGAAALNDVDWARSTRIRLTQDAERLDATMTDAGASVVGGTPLFRLYEVANATEWQTRLAHHHIWTRVFPYNSKWLRLGLPAAPYWPRLEAALK